MTRLLQAVKVGALLLGALLAALAFLPEYRGTALRVYVLSVGVLALLGLLGLIRARNPVEPSAFDLAVRPRRRRAERPEELTRVERELQLASTTAGDLHFRLRPRVRAIAAHRLSSRRGIDLDAEPGAARAVLPPAVWELVRPDREEPRDRFGRGIGREQLRAVVDGLDTI